MAKEKTVYVCSNCGQDSPKWVGKCPSCGMWNTYVEEVVRKEVVNKRPVSGIETAKAKPITLHEIVADDEPRIDLHDAELNRVLGGGLVQGSLVLIGGEPGIGKSTLVLQTVLRIPEKRILYVSGEESTRQLCIFLAFLEAFCIFIAKKSQKVID
jgi:DNA repair protein RadA/Sms